MESDVLRSELDQVTAELTAARTEYASLGAKIVGLEARQAALSKALAGTNHLGTGISRLATGYRTDAIVAILQQAGTNMSIQEVTVALRDAGRPHEIQDNVGVDLAYLTEQGRVARIRRGVYAAVTAAKTGE